MSEIDQIRHLLERNNYRLTGRSHLRELIPAILENQIRLLKAELRHPQASRQCKSHPVSIIFDGSARLGEAVVVPFGFVSDNNWEIKQRLLKVAVLVKSLKAAELAKVLNVCTQSSMR